MLNGEHYPMSREAIHTAAAIRFLDKSYDTMNGVHKGNVSNQYRIPMSSTSYHLEFLKKAEEIVHKMRYVDKKITIK